MFKLNTLFVIYLIILKWKNLQLSNLHFFKKLIKKLFWKNLDWPLIESQFNCFSSAMLSTYARYSLNCYTDTESFWKFWQRMLISVKWNSIIVFFKKTRHHAAILDFPDPLMIIGLFLCACYFDRKWTISIWRSVPGFKCCALCAGYFASLSYNANAR